MSTYITINFCIYNNNKVKHFFVYSFQVMQGSNIIYTSDKSIEGSPHPPQNTACKFQKRVLSLNEIIWHSGCDVI